MLEAHFASVRRGTAARGGKFSRLSFESRSSAPAKSGVDSFREEFEEFAMRWDEEQKTEDTLFTFHVDTTCERLIIKFGRAVGMDYVELRNEIFCFGFEVTDLKRKARRHIKSFTRTLKDKRVTAFLPLESTVLKLELDDGLTDSSFFFLLGKIRLTESEMVRLCESLQLINSPELELQLARRPKRRAPPEDEEYKEVERRAKTVKRPKLLKHKSEPLKLRAHEPLTFRDFIDTRVTNARCSVCDCTPGIRMLALASLDGCSHRFCFDCILEWAQLSCNKCPLCRAEFFKICREVNILQSRQYLHVRESVEVWPKN